MRCLEMSLFFARIEKRPSLKKIKKYFSIIYLLLRIPKELSFGGVIRGGAPYVQRIANPLQATLKESAIGLILLVRRTQLDVWGDGASKDGF